MAGKAADARARSKRPTARIVDSLDSIHVWAGRVGGRVSVGGVAIVSEKEAKDWCAAGPFRVSVRVTWFGPAGVVRWLGLGEPVGGFDPLDCSEVDDAEVLFVHTSRGRDSFRERVTDRQHFTYSPVFLLGRFTL